MTNEEKAHNIVKEVSTLPNLLEYEAMTLCATKMAKLKDEEHAKEKRQWIDKAWNYLKENMIGLDMGKYPMYSQNFINDFRKVMEE